MGTRSQIGMELADKTVESVYCHFDGYVEGVGKTLVEHYTDPKKVAMLISHGGMSSLGDEIGDKHDFNHREENVCTFYHRDRGEELVTESHKTSASYAEYEGGGIEYLYLFRGGEWFTLEVRDDRKKWVRVSTLLKTVAFR